MRYVAPPTHVGHRNWPVVSAVRVGTNDAPAQFIVIVHCADATPREPYATLHVYVWPDRIRAEDGEFDFTFGQARRSLAERAGLLPAATVEVIAFGDSAEPNAYTVFVDGQIQPEGATVQGVRVVTHDILIDVDHISPAMVAAERQRAQDTLSSEAACLAGSIINALEDGYAPYRQDDQ